MSPRWCGAFGELRRTLKPAGTFFLNLGDTYYSAKGRPHGRDDKHNGRQMMRRHLRAVDGPGLGLPRKSLIGIPWRVALALQDDGWTLRSSIIWQRPASLPEPTAHDRPWRTFEYVFLFSKSPRYWFHRARARRRRGCLENRSPARTIRARISPLSRSSSWSVAWTVAARRAASFWIPSWVREPP